MGQPKYLRIPGAAWRRYQQKERADGWRPPWLKLWNKWLDDFELRMLTPETRLVHVGLLIVANETGNLIPSSHAWLATRLTLPPQTIATGVNELVAAGLIERCAARPPAVGAR